jgi:hypothetical protein
MDDCRWWVGACGVGPLYPFVDGGGLVMQPRGCWVYMGAGGVKKDVCRGLFVNVALLVLP